MIFLAYGITFVFRQQWSYLINSAPPVTMAALGSLERSWQLTPYQQHLVKEIFYPTDTEYVDEVVSADEYNLDMMVNREWYCATFPGSKYLQDELLNYHIKCASYNDKNTTASSGIQMALNYQSQDRKLLKVYYIVKVCMYEYI